MFFSEFPEFERQQTNLGNSGALGIRGYVKYTSELYTSSKNKNIYIVFLLVFSLASIPPVEAFIANKIYIYIYIHIDIYQIQTNTLLRIWRDSVLPKS